MPHKSSSKEDIVIIDYGMGNLRSVYNKCSRVGYKALISSDIEVVSKAKKLILPGVGHYSNGMRKIEEMGLLNVLNQRVIKDKIPILGICLGMQLFTNHSEEGDVKGFGWIDAQTVRFKISDKRWKIPQMGWNSLIQKKESPILKELDTSHLYYFVHSYHLVCNNKSDVLTTSYYGYEFVSSVEKENIFGVQFHPEKSHEWGEHILQNFLKI